MVEPYAHALRTIVAACPLPWGRFSARRYFVHCLLIAGIDLASTIAITESIGQECFLLSPEVGFLYFYARCEVFCRVTVQSGVELLSNDARIRRES